ncbi:exosome complex component CSL4-like [Adelges cooleyi]|uniref:exosome complex component CSL4-like n=1 Tax=Adelges cooleyi TaxID=133065 RepID=UPI00218069FA|nr:exosome complex component CSL4-like [Adelges cooleyi]
MESKIICVPGQKLCRVDPSYILGKGTYERDHFICSSLAGIVNINKNNGVTVIEVVGKNQLVVPAPGNTVTAQVVKISRQLCKCRIMSVDGYDLNQNYRACLKKENIRSKEIDQVDIAQCFRPGDIILAKVLPIEEANTFRLTTAKNELGVILANSEFGHPMIPISWTEMQCTVTDTVERRKVAKTVQKQN